MNINTSSSMDMEEVVRPFKRLTRGDIVLAGGKGAGLGAMVEAGLPVPPGFVILTNAYWTFVEQAGIRDEIVRLSAAVDPDDLIALDAVSARIRSLFDQGEVPRNVEAAITTAYMELGGSVAVRSSATAEDLPDASFAGQQDTYLNIRGAGAVVTAVKRCWSSLWTGRALSYRIQNGIAPDNVAMAVVVQHMVAADAAGVLFTADPVSGRLDQMVIDGAWGLGESVVSGIVSPDHWLVDAKTGRVISKRISAKTVMTVQMENGTAEQPVPADLVHKPALNSRQAAALVHLGSQAAAYFGAPQDVEWAVAKGQFYLLQSRPITTLANLEELPELSSSSGRSSPAQFLERFPMAPKPLDTVVLDTLSTGIARALGFLGFKIKEEEASGPAPVWRTGAQFPKIRPTLKLLGIFRRIGTFSKDPLGWWEQELKPALISLSQVGNLSALSDQDVLALPGRILPAWQELFGQRMVRVVAGVAMSLPLRLLVRSAVGGRRAAAVSAALLMGVPTKTTETTEALWRISRLVRAEPAVADLVRSGNWRSLSSLTGGETVLREFETFLSSYGHREGAGFYLSDPTWRHAPTRVWAILRSMAEVEDPPANGSQQYQAALQSVLSRLRRWPRLARRFEDLVRRARASYAFRENSHFDLTRPLDALQSIAAELGSRLADRGLLAAQEDIFYLTLPEVKHWFSEEHPTSDESQAMIARRKAAYKVINNRWQTSGKASRAAEGKELRGVGASSGAVRARARVIRGEGDFGRLQPGEVLVCLYTNPSWTPLFASAAAVVAERGGAISHAAIVAREYQIPAVMGVAGALERIKDDQVLLVDGDRGVVIIMEDD